MSLSKNRFLQQLGEKDEEILEENIVNDKKKKNRFLTQINEPKNEAEKLEEKIKGIKSFGKDIANPRNLMQGALGAAKGALYTSPAAIPSILGEFSLPGAIDATLLE